MSRGRFAAWIRAVTLIAALWPSLAWSAGPGTRSVDLNLSEEKPAGKLDIEIRAAGGGETKVRTTTESNWLAVKLAPGSYELRSRPHEIEKRKLEWSRWRPFSVAADSEIWPHHESFLQPVADAPLTVNFKWPATAHAYGYVFLLQDAAGNAVKKIRTVLNSCAVDFTMTQRYSWTAIPVMDQSYQVATDTVSAWQSFETDALMSTMQWSTFTMPPVEKASAYQTEITRFYAREIKGQPRVITKPEPELKIRLAPGRYQIRQRAVVRGRSGKWSEPANVFISVPPPQLTKPADRQEFLATGETKNEINLQWQAVPYAAFYRLKVFKSDGSQVISRIVTEPQALVEVADNAEYRWQVLAYVEDEPERESSPGMETRTFRIGEFARIKFIAAEEPYEFYGWYRQLTSFYDYQSQNFDRGAQVAQKIFGGESEGGVGYWIPKSRYGLLLTGQIAGFTIVDQSYFYQGAAVWGGIRLGLTPTKRLRLWAGAAYREVPEIRATSPTTVDFEKTQSMGPVARLIYLDELGSNFGWSFFLDSYYGFYDVRTPNGGQQLPRLSYSAGLQGSWKFRENLQALLGYTYVTQNAAYQSSTPGGSSNTIEIVGHAFSLALLFGIAL